MVKRIERDRKRFDDIVRGRVKKDLRKHITQSELIGKQGSDIVSIPLPRIDLPKFRYGRRERGGVGQGPGNVGDPIGGDGESGAPAGDQPGFHPREVELSIDEMTKLLGEALELPRIEPKGAESLTSVRGRYTGIRTVGPETLRSFRRTYREALKRQISTGTYDPMRPTVVPVRDDMRYRSWRDIQLPVANAVIFYLMDVSGSMASEQKEIVRIESFWIDNWIRGNYDGVVSRYIIHDAQAKEVDRETFFSTRESGGTRISTAYELAADLADREHPPADWNLYFFHFSDGDNLGSGDNEKCFGLLRERLLPMSNLFGYGQVESRAGSGAFLGALEANVEADNLILSKIANRESILDSIRDFLGTGK
jgi:uncharacterized sporulation protein YeaH/YhbH (DUF444 family)